MSKLKTLSERLADLTTAAPSTAFDPEALEFDDGTRAGTSGYQSDDDNQDQLSSASNLRPSASLRVAADMESIGHEYRGKKISRKALDAAILPQSVVPAPGALHGVEYDGSSARKDYGDDTNQAIPSLNLNDVSSSSGDDEEVRNHEEQSAGETHSNGDSSGPDGEDRKAAKRGKRKWASASDGMVQASVFGSMVDEQIAKLYQQDDKAMKGRGTTSEVELKRGQEALRQRQWWDSLLEVRILLQRLMNVANRLPGPDELPLFLNDDETLSTLAAEGANAAKSLANQLSAARQSQMACWGINGDGETENHASCSTRNKDGASDSVDIMGAAEGKSMDNNNDPDEEVAARDHVRCMAWWKMVLGRWHERTQLVDPKLQRTFKVVNQGPWAHVMAVLADRERANRKAFMIETETEQFLGRKLSKRLRIMRARKTAMPHEGVAGKREESESASGDADVVEVLGRERREVQAFDLEVLDDRDLYQHLLKEFMDSSSAEINGHSAPGVHTRGKSRKKVVDRRASKGRKIKYVTHPKMQNFMFPQDYPAPTMEPSELFSSLFGSAGIEKSGVVVQKTVARE